MIAEKYLQIREEVMKICRETTGETEPDCTLIAVSKTKPVEMIKEAYDAGCRDFGENKVQELTEKCGQLPEDIRWHMIGHLQTNKVKDVVGKAYMIHSVDSVRLARKISEEAVKKQTVCRILLEVNVAREETKYGFRTEEVLSACEEISLLPGVRICGLMTIAPFTEEPESNRIYFNKLKQLSVDISSKNIDNVFMNVLSMGMTGDYTAAIREGATYVRVGTGIFGDRQYNI